MILKPYSFNVYPPPGSRPTGTHNSRPTGLNDNQNFSHSSLSTPFGSPNLDQLNQTLLALSTQNQTVINQLVETQICQKEAFTTMAEAEEKRGYDLDFTSIPIFDRRDKTKFHEWCRCTQYTCAYSNRNLHQELLQRSAGAVTTVLLKWTKTSKQIK